MVTAFFFFFLSHVRLELNQGVEVHSVYPDTSNVNKQPAVFSHETVGISVMCYFVLLYHPPCLISFLCSLLTSLELQPCPQ